MTLEQLGAVAAILTCLGGVMAVIMKFGQIRYRRFLIERYLINLTPKFQSHVHLQTRRKVGQLAVELGMTSAQVYEAARNSKKLKRGRDGTSDELIWFEAKQSPRNSG